MTLGQAILAAARARYSIPDGRGTDMLSERLRLAPSTVLAYDAGQYDPPGAQAARLARAHRLHITLTPDGWAPVPATSQETS